MVENLNQRRGFTIVELLVVIVVIAILATVTIVSYNGIQRRAVQARVDSNVNNILKKAQLHQTVTGSYPSAASAYQTAVFTSTDPSTSLPNNLYTIYVAYADVVDYNAIVREGSLDASAGYVIKPCTGSGYTGMLVYYPDVISQTLQSKTIGAC